ncbi:MAG: response regulator [Acidobacteria bacterium]|nr:response regulator [Acidobacteriota bacterium]
MQERASQLCQAILRISASLDLDVVLKEIIDSARALTGARYGVIVAMDDAREIQDYVMSGFANEEVRQLLAWPDAVRFYEHLRDLPERFVVEDPTAYIRTLGLTAHMMPAKNLQGTPMRHRGAQVGCFFLAGKEGSGTFTDEDEEILVLFASQAAAAIANARVHRGEQRARANLEAVIDTTPVGVIVFDGRTGRAMSLNREARRIVQGLVTPGGTADDLRESVTVRRLDGREIILSEMPLAQALADTDTVRSEEMVVSVPDGRSIAMLVNVTPIRTAAGETETVVVTVQDLAPLKELERQRAEFLALVSHELRSPLTAIKGSCATVLDASPTPDRPELLQLFRIVNAQADHMRGLVSDLLDSGRIETGTLSVTPEPEDVATLIDQARSTFMSGGGRHVVDVDLPRDLPLVLADGQRVVQVLNNLISNAARHSSSSLPIGISVEPGDLHLAISVVDHGEGIPADQLPHLFQKHASFAGDDHERRTARSGLGLHICKGLVEAHGGRVWADSGPEGTRFAFTLPVSEGTVDSARPGAEEGTAGSPSRTRARKRILVVDDDPQTLRYVRGALAATGYEPLVTGDPREISSLIKSKKPGLVLLDLMLPGADGIELLERIPELHDLPVIFISGYKRDETVARALEVGAVDYIVKPFSQTELIARIRAALRRRAEPERFWLGDLCIRYDQRRVTVAGHPVRLTATEYELLRVLSVNAGRVLTYDSLLRRVWSGRDTEDWRAVRAYVKRLRRKLGDDSANARYIQTERGVGYRMPLRTSE